MTKIHNSNKIKDMKRIIFTICAFLLISLSFSCGSVPTEEKKEETKVEKKEEKQKNDAEYQRSIGQLASGDSVTKEEFINDKAEIINTIKELQKIMDRQDYEAWLKYISKGSIQYYSSPLNIRKANKRLPDKTINLRGLEDYFKYVFIPSRKQSQVDEIRYISKSEVKAVQVLPNDSTFVYYNFIREDGMWKVNIPTL